MLGDPHRIESQFLGEHEVFDFLADESRIVVVLASLVGETGRQAYMHRRSPFTAGPADFVKVKLCAFSR